jgi:hypothetical protein
MDKYQSSLWRVTEAMVLGLQSTACPRVGIDYTRTVDSHPPTPLPTTHGQSVNLALEKKNDTVHYYPHHHPSAMTYAQKTLAFSFGILLSPF